MPAEFFLRTAAYERLEQERAALLAERDAAREALRRVEEERDYRDVQLAAADQRMRALAERWCAMDPYGEISFNDAADALLAALDGTDHQVERDGSRARCSCGWSTAAALDSTDPVEAAPEEAP